MQLAKGFSFNGNLKEKELLMQNVPCMLFEFEHNLKPSAGFLKLQQTQRTFLFFQVAKLTNETFSFSVLN